MYARLLCTENAIRKISKWTIASRCKTTIANVKKCVYQDSLHFFISATEKDNEIKSRMLPSSLLKTDMKKLAVKEDDGVTAIINEIEEHYSLDNSKQFVGGMGENDGGVWLISEDIDVTDTLEFSEDISEITSQVKQSRHGIKFGLYSSGLTKDPDIATSLPSMGVSNIRVSLMASNPDSYGKLTGMNSSDATKAFAHVCGFIAVAAESGFKVTAAVSDTQQASASDLAKALGAVNVIVYDSI
jgi:hypothetical protein